MGALSKTVLLVACTAVFVFSSSGFTETKTESVEDFLPQGKTTSASYVEIERDPGLDDFTRRMKEAREKNKEWYIEYSRKHQKADFSPLPYHENFGVSKEEYEHFVIPMNHFREIVRKEIKIRKSSKKGKLQLNFEGEDLLLTKVVLNLKDRTAETSRDVLPLKSFVDLQRASLPPGRHKGILFRTPRAKIISDKRRESLLIGELKDKNFGIIHYSLQTPKENRRMYIQYPK